MTYMPATNALRISSVSTARGMIPTCSSSVSSTSSTKRSTSAASTSGGAGTWSQSTSLVSVTRWPSASAERTFSYSDANAPSAAVFMISANRTVSRRRGSAVAYRAETFSMYRTDDGELFVPPAKRGGDLEFEPGSRLLELALRARGPRERGARGRGGRRDAEAGGERGRNREAGGRRLRGRRDRRLRGHLERRRARAEIERGGSHGRRRRVRRVGRTFRALGARCDEPSRAARTTATTRLLVFVEGDAPAPSRRRARCGRRRAGRTARAEGCPIHLLEADAISLYTRFTTRHTRDRLGTRGTDAQRVARLCGSPANVATGATSLRLRAQ